MHPCRSGRRCPVQRARAIPAVIAENAFVEKRYPDPARCVALDILDAAARMEGGQTPTLFVEDMGVVSSLALGHPGADAIYDDIAPVVPRRDSGKL